ncbi:SDR family NAD(P)-dependent oxidoreductase, partial [Streptomyces sp. NPDC048612]|uniref:SDR family NAD(P)-dependent oxidoreductase n=1 Tax=Streptomyces sp. NPDC048612 TaxID=3365579 RepID=UPI003722FA5C
VLAEQGARTKKLSVSHAFHSVCMEPMLEEFRTVAQSLTYETARIPVVSNLTGEIAGPELSTPDYWVRHVREAVRFADGVQTLHAQGVTRFIELGPDGVLTAMAQSTLTDAENALFVPVLRRDRDEAHSLVTGLGQLHAHGGTVDWSAFFAGTGARRVALPTYAFQRSRYWLDATPAAVPRQDGVDAEFWDAVEGGEPGALADVLSLDADQLAPVLPALTSWRQRRMEQRQQASFHYEIAWNPVAVTVAPAEGIRDWAAVVPASDTDVAQTLSVRGAVVVSVQGEADADIAELIRKEAGDTRLKGVLSLLPDGPSTLTLLQSLVTAQLDIPLWCVTRGATSVGEADPAPSVDSAGVWGLGRVAGLELPQMWGGLIDLPAAPEAQDWDRMGSVLAAGSGGTGTGSDSEDQVAVRSGGVFARRVVRATATGMATPSSPGDAWRPRGTVLITGGTGALGAQVARWAVAEGAERLVLISRRGPDAPGAAELRDELVAQGAEVAVVAVDAADRDALSGVLAAYPPDAVVHAAGVARVAPLLECGAGDLASVAEGKVQGAMLLDELTRDRELDAFVLFSSISGVWGSGGQAAYAAANARLDALVEARRASGLVATSLAWGPWEGEGMAAGEAGDELRLRGLRPLQGESALAALGTAVGSGRPLTVLADVDWERFAPVFTALRPSPLFRELPEAARAAEPATGPADPETRADDLVKRLTPLAPADRGAELVLLVRDRAARVLGHTTPEGIPGSRAFRELGFDSLTAVELRNLLREATGLSLPATLTFDFPTPAAIAEHLQSLLFADEDGVPAAAGDPKEAALRDALATVPLSRLRDAGLLDALYDLAGLDPETSAGSRDLEHLDSIDAMDAARLIEMALDHGDS